MHKYRGPLLVGALALWGAAALAQGFGFGLGSDEGGPLNFTSGVGGGGGNCILIAGTTSNCLLVSGTTTNSLLVK